MGQVRGESEVIRQAVHGVLWRLLFVLGILGVGVSLLWPTPSRVRTPSRRGTCASNLRQIGIAVKLYAQDWEEAFPPDIDTLYRLYPESIGSGRCFSCPTTPSPWKRIRETGRVRPAYTSYVYVVGLTDSDDTACVLAFDRPGNHGEDGVNVLFLDTHVDWCTFEEFEQHLARTRALAAESGREIELVRE